MWDSEYGCAPFIIKTADIAADKLMRLRSNLCLFNAPPTYSGKGRPRVHGAKFKLNDSSTWSTPAETIEIDDPKLGRIRIQLWHKLHLTAAPKHPMSIIRVERLDEHGVLRVIKPLWLAWIGEEMPPLLEIWQIYLRRFGVDHWYRFARATFTLDFTKTQY